MDMSRQKRTSRAPQSIWPIPASGSVLPLALGGADTARGGLSTDCSTNYKGWLPRSEQRESSNSTNRGDKNQDVQRDIGTGMR